MTSLPGPRPAPLGAEAASPIAAHLGARLRATRQEAGLSLAELARLTGLTKGFLSKLERGLSHPSVESVYRLARVLGVPPGVLLASESAVANGMELAPASDPDAPVGPGRWLRSLFPVAPGRLTALEIQVPHTPDEDAGGSHEGEELLRVLDGEIELLLNNEPTRLKAGDTVRFDARHRHRLRSVGPARARVLVVFVAPE
ncbi:helix-turn-helix domain-containing protein [Rhodovarius lipocyclicus]|uniref:helix-turn-helix domain-containing protein n=1 Tax=Rhodovarius lipocyclicus TaxID=268410 RepID=UPI0013575A94|nr:XRE family transcriptional regulator [Rhodovarius lipocyclicus]